MGVSSLSMHRAEHPQRGHPAMRIQAMGGLRLLDANGRERAVSTRKTAVLAVYLAMHQDKRLSRDSLAGLLWGDKEDTWARHSLSQALSDLRKAFGQDVIRTQSQHVWMPAGAAWVDAQELSAAARAGVMTQQPQTYATLYGGDFLEGLDLQQESFDAWAASEREHLRSTAIQCLTELVEQQLAQSDYGGALHSARRVAELEPFNERNHRAIMRCYALQGADRQAHDHYDTLVGALDDDLGVQPEPATTALRDEIAGGAVRSGEDKTLKEFAFVLEQMPYSVVVVDNDDRIVGWNRISEEAFGFSKEEIVGRSSVEIRMLAAAPGGGPSTTGANPGGRPWIGEVRVRAKNGHEQRRTWIMAPLFSRGGERLGAFGHELVA